MQKELILYICFFGSFYKINSQRAIFLLSFFFKNEGYLHFKIGVFKLTRCHDYVAQGVLMHDNSDFLFEVRVLVDGELAVGVAYKHKLLNALK